MSFIFADQQTKIAASIAEYGFRTVLGPTLNYGAKIAVTEIFCYWDRNRHKNYRWNPITLIANSPFSFIKRGVLLGGIHISSHVTVEAFFTELWKGASRLGGAFSAPIIRELLSVPILSKLNVQGLAHETGSVWQLWNWLSPINNAVAIGQAISWQNLKNLFVHKDYAVIDQFANYYEYAALQKGEQLVAASKFLINKLDNQAQMLSDLGDFMTGHAQGALINPINNPVALGAIGVATLGVTCLVAYHIKSHWLAQSQTQSQAQAQNLQNNLNIVLQSPAGQAHNSP